MEERAKLLFEAGNLYRTLFVHARKTAGNRRNECMKEYLNARMVRLFTAHRTEEHRLICRYAATQASFGGDGATLEPLGGWVRTKESSIGAVGNVAGGVGQMITGNGGRFRGVLRVGQGALDVLDILPSVAADGLRNVAGTPSNAHDPSGYNVTRAARHVTDIRTDDPVNAVKDAVVVVADNIHSLIFKSGSDVLRAIRNASNN